MKRIMFVCHGNICRSPMAEFIMKQLVKNRGLENEFYISSSATHTDEIFNGTGSPVYPPAAEQLRKNAIPFDANKRAVLLRREDYGNYDLFICMDDENLFSMRRIFGREGLEKCFKLLSFAGEQRNVSDPWYTRDFDKAFNDILTGCKALLDYCTEEEK